MKKQRLFEASSNPEYPFSFPEKLFGRPVIVSTAPIHTVFCHSASTPIEIITRNWGRMSVKAIGVDDWEFQTRFFPFEENQTTLLAPKGALLKVTYSNWWGRSKAEFVVPHTSATLPTVAKSPVLSLRRKPTPLIHFLSYLKRFRVLIPRIAIPRIATPRSIQPSIAHWRMQMKIVKGRFRAETSSIVVPVTRALSKFRHTPPRGYRDLIRVERKPSRVLDYIKPSTH